MGSGETPVICSGGSNTNCDVVKPSDTPNTTLTYGSPFPAGWSEITLPLNAVPANGPDPLVDTLHIAASGNVGLSNSSPQYTLDVGGDINTSTQYRISGISINTAGTLTNVAYLNQDNIFTGHDVFRNAADSTTAFQIQNAAGTPLLIANTTSMVLTVSALAVTGTLTLNGHIITAGSVPTIAAGAAACTTPTVSIAGNDIVGHITVTTGTGCGAGGQLATITFNAIYSATPRILLTPGSAQSANLLAYQTSATNQFILNATNAPANTTTYTFDYLVAQ
jgi:hypothetical protein